MSNINNKYYLISPEQLLKLRFGKSYNKIVSEIPCHSIISFFDNSISLIEKDFEIITKINWFGNYSKLIIFCYLDTPISLITLPPSPSLASMALEELIFCGVKNVISIGVAGSINAQIKPHDIVIPTESYMDEGIAKFYTSNNFYTSCSKTIIKSIEHVMQQLKLVYHKGLCWSISTPYRESIQSINEFQKEKVICVDMESASLFAIAEHYNMNLSSIFFISDTIENEIWTPHFKSKKTSKMKKLLLEIALQSIINS